MSAYVIHPAKTARSTCVDCHEKIDKDVLRLGQNIGCVPPIRSCLQHVLMLGAAFPARSFRIVSAQGSQGSRLAVLMTRSGQSSAHRLI